MWWKYVVEAILVVILMGVSGSFWSLLRSPGHMRNVLSNRATLADFFQFVGHQELSHAAASIPSELDYIQKAVDWWHQAHKITVGKAVIRLLPVCVAILVGSYFLGTTYLAVNGGIFILVAFAAPLSSAKNMNMEHIRTMATTLLRWHELDAESCSTYCRETRPELKVLHEVLAEM